MKSIFYISIALWLHISYLASETVIVATNFGEIVVELDEKHSPETVENFLTYVDENFYDNTIFHRVIDGSIILGGGYTTNYNEKLPTHPPIRSEAKNGLKNSRGTIAMARTMKIDSATSQFFINVRDNDFYNHHGDISEDYGYCVFGKVIEGMDVVDAISNVPTHFFYVPDTEIEILFIRRIGIPK